MVNTIRETNDYRYDVDRLYGTGWFVRKSDDMVSLMDTGSDRETRLLAMPLLTDNGFNLMAKQQTYNNRWEED